MRPRIPKGTCTLLFDRLHTCRVMSEFLHLQEMEGDWPSLQLSLVFRECSGRGTEAVVQPQRLSGEADFDVSSKVMGWAVFGWLACALDKDASQQDNS